MPFMCSICGEESTRICAVCTKDACSNHLCEKCACCSDCCDCEIAIAEPVREYLHAVPPRPEPDREPETPHPPPDPDPFPEDEPEPGVTAR